MVDSQLKMFMLYERVRAFPFYSTKEGVSPKYHKVTPLHTDSPNFVDTDNTLVLF